MTQQTDNTPGTNKTQVIEYSYWPFFRAWILSISIVAALVLILRYVFHINLLF